jgi:hypothetical protein
LAQHVKSNGIQRDSAVLRDGYYEVLDKSHIQAHVNRLSRTYLVLDGFALGQICKVSGRGRGGGWRRDQRGFLAVSLLDAKPVVKAEAASTD